MIKKLLIKLISTVAPPEEVIAKPVEHDSIYIQLKNEMDSIGNIEIDLRKVPASMGVYESFAPSLRAFVKLLIEVNNVLESNEKITRDFLLLRVSNEYAFDNFIFVEDGFYIENPGENLQYAFEQIERYHKMMDGADKVSYGTMEHNHRQLYKFTQTLTEFVTSVVYYFGK